MYYEELAVEIRNYCGIDFTKSIDNLKLKISRRLKELQLEITQYMKLLKESPKEWDKLIEVITINETYFFREINQLEEFQHQISQKTNRNINIWCIPCSTGEEAYSLAILAKEMELTTGNRVRIIASDLNKKVLDYAKKGFYPKNSLAFRRFPTDKEYLKRYFVEHEDGYEVKKEIKEMITFEPFNLTDYHAYQKHKGVDFIFCRNVLFYFNEHIVEEIMTHFYNVLKDDGSLFLGHAESISSLHTSFQPAHSKHAYYYVKGE